jgi:DNA mismatch repair protein MutS
MPRCWGWWNNPRVALLPAGIHAEFPPADKLTPLFKQYVEIKAQHPGSLLLYRLGDFYELFGPDAVHASGLLGLTLTARQALKDYTVAICEQVEDPAQAKGLVERAVTRVITAGTLIEDEYLAADSNNFLAVLVVDAGKAKRGVKWGLALLESSGGRVELMEGTLPAGEAGDGWPARLADEALRHYPAELLVPAELAGDGAFTDRVRQGPGLYTPSVHQYAALPTGAQARAEVERYFSHDIAQLSLSDAKFSLQALAVLLRYLRETFRTTNMRLYPEYKHAGGVLRLDQRSIRDLELLGNSDGRAGGGPAQGGVYGVINRCVTSAGRRELKRWLGAPTAMFDELRARQAAVELLLANGDLRERGAEQLGAMADFERIVHRVCMRRSNPRELRSLAETLPRLESLGGLLGQCDSALLQQHGKALYGNAALLHVLDSALADEPPVATGSGAAILQGCDADLDELRRLCGGDTQWFADYEAKLRSETGIRTLKVKQTGPTGWFIEVSKAQAALVPAAWQRRQTLVSAERFATPELREREALASTAQSRLAAREAELLEELYRRVEAEATRLSRAAQAAAELDVLAGLATVAAEQRWCKTELIDGRGGSATHPAGSQTRPYIELTNARHPLVEASVGAQFYTANSCYLDSETQQILLLTGPNMGGKSSYLRMLAVLAVINQLAGYVPAERAAMPLLDRVFTRIGAHDSLSRGQSTFMVEMVETAQVLRECTPASLVILDEIGRGTTTYDGISIAKAVLEYLHEHPARPFTLFATHFFELTDLEAVLPRLANFQVEVAHGARSSVGAELARPALLGEARAEQPPPLLILTYRVIPGAASDSYGLEVARQAGLPESVVQRAEAILTELEEAKRQALDRARAAVQMGLFSG